MVFKTYNGCICSYDVWRHLRVGRFGEYNRSELMHLVRELDFDLRADFSHDNVSYSFYNSIWIRAHSLLFLACTCHMCCGHWSLANLFTNLSSIDFRYVHKFISCSSIAQPGTNESTERCVNESKYAGRRRVSPLINNLIDSFASKWVIKRAELVHVRCTSTFDVSTLRKIRR